MVYTKMAVKYYEYHESKSWKDVKPGWLQVAVKYYDKPSEQHREVVTWLYDNVDNPERHARWMLDDTIGEVTEGLFKFRYERDCIHFTLRWS